MNKSVGDRFVYLVRKDGVPPVWKFPFNSGWIGKIDNGENIYRNLLVRTNQLETLENECKVLFEEIKKMTRQRSYNTCKTINNGGVSFRFGTGEIYLGKERKPIQQEEFITRFDHFKNKTKRPVAFSGFLIFELDRIVRRNEFYTPVLKVRTLVVKEFTEIYNYDLDDPDLNTFLSATGPHDSEKSVDVFLTEVISPPETSKYEEVAIDVSSFVNEEMTIKKIDIRS